MFSGPNIETAFRFTIISNIGITTQKICEQGDGNAVFKSK